MIRFIRIDRYSEGVSTRQIKLISWEGPFSETFYDSVKVQKKNLVGTLNDGWTIAKYLLTDDRQIIGGIGETDKKKTLSEVAIDSIGVTDKLLSNASIRSKIANLEMNEKILNTVWNWLHDKDHEVEGLFYEVNGKVVGFAHYRRMPRPLTGQDIGFLDDLYVHPECRGQKLSELLINELQKISKENNWNLVRWITRDDNERAKSLYDKVSEKTTWDTYELKWLKQFYLLLANLKD